MRNFLGVLGVVLVVLGVGVLCVCGGLFYQAFSSPDDVRVVRYIMDLAGVQGPVFKGAFSVMTPSGPQNSVFQLEMSPPIRGIVFLLIGVIFLSAVARVVSSVIASGVGLLRIAFPQARKEDAYDA